MHTNFVTFSCLPSFHTLRVTPAAHAAKNKLERLNTVITAAPQPSAETCTMLEKRLEKRLGATEKRLQVLEKRLQATDRELDLHVQQNATYAQEMAVLVQKGAKLKQKGTALLTALGAELVQAQKGTASNAEAAAGVAAGVAAYGADSAELKQQLAALGVALKDSALRCAELRCEELRCTALRSDEMRRAASLCVEIRTHLSERAAA